MRHLSLTALMLSALAGSGAAEVRLIQSSAGGSSLALIRGEGSTRIEPHPDASRVLELPAGTRLTNLVETGDGWIAAGNVGDLQHTELLLLAERAGELTILAPPADQQGAHRGRPVLFVRGGDLAGMAWLEGDRQEDLTVRAARRTAGGWSRSETVAPRGAGSQVALNGVALRDGSWLLVWTAFDGVDDDTVWSLSTGGGWTAPRRLHADNEVPDVFPSLAAHHEGAMASWSAYDGSDYRLRLARFGGGGWRELSVDSGRGSHLASFVRPAADLLLLYRTIVPDGWSLLALDERGRVTRRASVTGSGGGRPLVRRAAERGSGLVLEWPGSEAGTSGRVEPVIWRVAP